MWELLEFALMFIVIFGANAIVDLLVSNSLSRGGPKPRPKPKSRPK